jgi:hypothetical protein
MEIHITYGYCIIFSFFCFVFGGMVGLQATNNWLAQSSLHKFQAVWPRKNTDTSQRNAQMHTFVGQCGAAGLTNSSATAVLDLDLGKHPATH